MSAFTICAIILVLQAVNVRSVWDFNHYLDHDVLDSRRNEDLFIVWEAPSTSETVTTQKITTQQPCHESLYVKEDIETIVNYMYDQLNLNESIHISYYKYAKDVHDSKIKRIDGFEEWFSGNPKQLKDIVEDIAKKYKHIEPKVIKLSKLLDEQESLNNKMKNHKQRYTALLKKFNLYKDLCKENCAHKISKRSVDYENEYCGNAKEIKEKSTSEMQNYVEKLKPDLLMIVKNVSQEYDINIENMEKKIKEVALNDYGPIMYDTLLLQNEYHNYNELVSQNMEKKIYDIKKSIMLIESQLMDLDLAVEKYKQHCISCTDNSNAMVYRMSASISDINIIPQPKLGSLLEIVIKSKTDQIYSQVISDILYLFHDVEEKMQTMEQRDMDVKNFKPAQEDIKNELKKVRETLADFKKLIAKKNIDAFLSLEESAELLKSDINDLLNELHREINI